MVKEKKEKNPELREDLNQSVENGAAIGLFNKMKCLFVCVNSCVVVCLCLLVCLVRIMVAVFVFIFAVSTCPESMMRVAQFRF